ncbi:AbgT family transporter [Vulgatibacter sp.]|uniref:AbgT family transporter n=1 Tax=Vulgatibacter sp. TaxID=1971226 RepID=UPI00356130A9
MPEVTSAAAATPAPRGFTLRWLDRIERIGNRLPDPLTIFVILGAVVLVASWLAAAAGVSVQHPGTGATISATNLLSAEGLRRIATELVPNFAAFPPLGTVLVAMIGIGVAERSGLVAAALKGLVAAVPQSLLTATLVFAGVMSSMAADAGYVVLTPLGAVLFAGIGRHPIAGLAAAFAGVSGGFSANLLLTSLDPLLAGLTQPAARIVDPAYVVQPTANYYFMLVSVVLVVAVGTFVTGRFVEPRLGTWSGNGADEGGEASLGTLEPRERRGLLVAGLAFLAVLGVAAAMTLPADGVLRSPSGGLEPFFSSLVPLILVAFFVPGLAYGVVAQTIRSDKTVAKMTGDTMATMGPYIVLAFVAAQFVAWFGWSNLGLIFAVQGAELLQASGLAGIALLIGFVAISGGINLFIGSASAKWAIMAPVFVPMLMLLGYSPETVQATYRVGDSITNIITPLLPYFPIIVAFARRYDPQAGLGTLISAMLPYSIALAIAWVVLLVVWISLGIPLGPDAPVHYLPQGQAS